MGKPMLVILLIFVLFGFLSGWLVCRYWETLSRHPGTGAHTAQENAGSILREIAEDSSQHATQLQKFADGLDPESGEPLIPVGQMYETNRLYQERFDARADQVSAVAAETEACLLKLLRQYVAHSGNVGQLSEVLGRHLGSDVTGEVHRLLREAVLPVLESNRELQQQLQAAQNEMAKQERRLKETGPESRVDPMTRLPNRRAFDEQLSGVHSRFERGREGYAVVRFDLDNFEALNEAHGAAAGEAVLAVFGRILAGAVRGSDHPARIGEEEFAVLLPGAKHDDANIVANRCRQRVQGTSVRCGKHCLRFNVNVGVAAIKDDETPQQLLARADEALRAAQACTAEGEEWSGAPQERAALETAPHANFTR